MKFLIGLLTLVSLSANAQFGQDPVINYYVKDEKLVSFNFYLGFNSYHFDIEYNQYDPNYNQEIQTDKTIGFNVGLGVDLRVNDFLNLRFEPGLSSNTRSLVFPSRPPHYTTNIRQTRQVQSTYIHFPLLLKVSTLRKGNIRPFVVGGISTALNLSSNHDSQEDNTNGKFRSKKWTNYYEVGLGIDLYYPWFKFSPSIRGVFGTGNDLIHDTDPNSEWTGNISSMTTRGVFVNFTFR